MSGPIVFEQELSSFSFFSSLATREGERAKHKKPPTVRLLFILFHPLSEANNKNVNDVDALLFLARGHPGLCLVVFGRKPSSEKR